MPLHFFGSKSTIIRFGERFCDGQYSLVIFLFVVLLLTVPPVPSQCKSGGHVSPVTPCPMESAKWQSHCTGTTGDSGKEWLKRWVFKRFPQASIDDADVTFSGRVFHAVGQQRPEKLDRRWLKDECVGQQAMISKQSGDADEPRQQTTDGIPQRGTAELSDVAYVLHFAEIRRSNHAPPSWFMQKWRLRPRPRHSFSGIWHLPPAAPTKFQ